MPLVNARNGIILDAHATNRVFAVCGLILMSLLVMHAIIMSHGHMVMAAVTAMVVTTAATTATALSHHQINNPANYHNPY